MGKYIDADALKTIKSIQSADFNSIETIRQWIESAPSIDICFCKDCEFSEVIQNDSSGVMARYCKAFTIPMMRSDDDFCSYGVRKE